MKTLVALSLLTLYTLTSFASSGDPAPGTRVLNMGNRSVTVVFENTSNEFDILPEQLEIIAGRVAHLHGKFFFIIPSSSQGRIFPCGVSVSAKKSISINLPPYASLVEVQVINDGQNPKMSISGVRNSTSAWVTYSGFGSADVPAKDVKNRSLAQEKSSR